MGTELESVGRNGEEGAQVETAIEARNGERNVKWKQDVGKQKGSAKQRVQDEGQRETGNVQVRMEWN